MLILQFTLKCRTDLCGLDILWHWFCYRIRLNHKGNHVVHAVTRLNEHSSFVMVGK